MERRAVLTFLGLTAILGSFALTGCPMAPVRNVSGARAVTASGQSLSEDEVREVLVRALIAKHYRIETDQPGQIVATVQSGGHSATIRITYNAAGYAINHVTSSPGLKYEPDSQVIHRRYNRWVVHLEAEIQKQLAKL